MSESAISELNTQLTHWELVRSGIWFLLRYYRASKMWNEEEYLYWQGAWNKANDQCKRIKESLEVI